MWGGKTMRIFRHLEWFLKKERKAYITGIILLIFVAILELIPPKVIGITVDLIEQGELTRKVLTKWILILLIIAIVLYICRFFWRSLIFGASLRLARHFRNELYKQYTVMSPSFYQRYKTGDLMAHATNDIQAVQQTVGVGILTLVDSLALGGFVLLTMAITINWKLTLICLIPMPFLAFATNFYSSLIHKRFAIAQEAFSTLNDKVLESINGIKVLKSIGQEDEDCDHFNEKSEGVVQKNLSVARIDALYDPTIYFVVSISLILAIGFGSAYVNKGEMTIGELISFTTYLGYLIWPMLAFGWLFNIVERGRASYDRIQSILSEVSEINLNEHITTSIEYGELIININEFSHPNYNSFSLNNINISIENGSTLGIAGRTGSGKTTLIKLILRHFKLESGFITINGININKFNLNSFRKSLSYVPQDNFLFSASIFENIAFAKPDASKEEVERVAKIANIHDDILEFENGYNTLIGERGVSLSGGQKQRISIARALLLDANLLLLDDCLSAVDARTEEKILNSLKNERRGKTTIIVSHRMSAIQHADEIVVLDYGKLIEKGNHTSLMSKNSWYKNMFEKQQLEIMTESGDYL
ncbi:MAG: multidrug transporter permease/ATP-binding protein [Bacillales bacterium]|jgi:ATP-binding cassette subfamily B protein|nr:multidrug transporter permease/ATP-binding protein [Bacillales bacterium]